MYIDVVFLQQNVAPASLQGRTVLVVDVLRATSTIATALNEGALAVYPTASLDDARKLATELPQALLGGERGGIAPEGFAAGNSPLEYTRERVDGRPVILTTTNGTQALHQAIVGQAQEIGTAALINARAAARWALSLGHDLTILCAGTEGVFSLEDALGAGCVVARCVEAGARPNLTDAAFVTKVLWERYEKAPATGFIDSEHGRRLLDLGFSADLTYCAGVDTVATAVMWRGGKLVSVQAKRSENE